MGILVLMMTLAGQVFNITVQSTGQATAITEVMQQLRAFERTLREDLRGVQPGNSLILIQGNPVNAYWTQNGKDSDGNGDPSDDEPYPADPERQKFNASGNLVADSPRADILMIFTARPGVSFIEAGATQPTSNLQQVVYGHAELGEYIPSGEENPKYTFEQVTGDQPYFPEVQDYPSLAGVAAVPASQWHLARRSVLLLPTPPPATGLSWNNINDASPNGMGLGNPKILVGEVDVVGDFQYEKLVVRPASTQVAPWFLPEVFGEDTSQPYSDWLKPFARSKLDPTPPALYANRIGHYLFPNCASFKVEWTLNPRSEFVAGRLDGRREVLWFDPGDVGTPTDPIPDPLRSLREAAINATGTEMQSLECLLGARVNGTLLDQCRPEHPDGMRYSLADRFRVGTDPDYSWPPLAPVRTRPNLVVFTATRPAPLPPGLPPPPPSEPVLDPMFPGALRITVDVFDKERRLDRPIRQVMVIPIGG